MALGLGKMTKKIGSGARSIGSSENIKKAGQVAGLANSNIGKSGGYKKLLGHAGTGAIAGGLSGAGINTLRGEDAWEGAKTGATLGAIGNAGTKGFKMAANSTGSMADAARSFKGQMGGMNKVAAQAAQAKPAKMASNAAIKSTVNTGARKSSKTSASASAAMQRKSTRRGNPTSFSTGKERSSGMTKSVGALQTMGKDSNQAKRMMSRR